VSVVLRLLKCKWALDPPELSTTMVSICPARAQRCQSLNGSTVRFRFGGVAQPPEVLLEDSSCCAQDMTAVLDQLAIALPEKCGALPSPRQCGFGLLCAC
jgi:hypothetical protein